MNLLKNYRGILSGVIVFAVIATLPFWLLRGPYLQGLGVAALTIAALSVAWNLVGGYAGRLSFGHAAFFGIGAYASTMLQVKADINPWIGMVVGMTLAALVALFLGSITTHLQGIYFTLVTFVFALLLMNLSRFATNFTGGDVGLSVPLEQPSFAAMQFRGQLPWFYFALIVLVFFMMIAYLLVRSPFGYKLRAIRDDQDVARALGVKAERVKLEAFVLSAVMVSFCGTFVAQYELFIDPASAFGLDRSVEIALGAILGGAGTLWGPVLGGVAIVFLSEGARVWLGNISSGADIMAYGAILVAVALWMPGGLSSLGSMFGKSTFRKSVNTTKTPDSAANSVTDEGGTSQ